MYFVFRKVQEDDTHNVVPKIRLLKNSTAFAPPHRCSRNNFVIFCLNEFFKEVYFWGNRKKGKIAHFIAKDSGMIT